MKTIAIVMTIILLAGCAVSPNQAPPRARDVEPCIHDGTVIVRKQGTRIKSMDNRHVYSVTCSRRK